jgi:hypothetical protein
MARKSKKKNAEAEWNGQITVLTGELSDVEREIDRIQAMTNQADPDDDAVIEIAAKRIAGATASRKRIKAINKAMAGKTLLELRKASGPMEALIMNHDIAGEEMMAIMDIEMAMMALSGAGMIKPVSLELKSSGKKGEWSKVTADAVENYVAWANFWSARQTYCDHTSEIVVRAVVHGHAFRVIERDVGIGTGRGAVICVRGLRDYAARSGWVARGIATKWMDDALTSFKHARPLTELDLAIARAKRLREGPAANNGLPDT